MQNHQQGSVHVSAKVPMPTANDMELAKRLIEKPESATPAEVQSLARCVLKFGGSLNRPKVSATSKVTKSK